MNFIYLIESFLFLLINYYLYLIFDIYDLCIYYLRLNIIIIVFLFLE